MGVRSTAKQCLQTTQSQLRRKMIKAQNVTGGSDDTHAEGEQKKEDEEEVRPRYPVHVEVCFVDTPGASTFNQREFGTQHVSKRKCSAVIWQYTNELQRCFAVA